MRLSAQGFRTDYLLKLGLNYNHVEVLRWFLSFTQKCKEMEYVDIEEDGETKRFYWIKYTKVIKDLPLLYIKNNIVIGNLFRKLCGQGKENYYEYPLEKHNTYDSKENRVYFRFRPNILEYMETLNMDNLIPGIENNKQRKVNKKQKHPANSKVISIFKKLLDIKENGKDLFTRHELPKDIYDYTNTFKTFQNILYTLYEGRFLSAYNLDTMANWYKIKYDYYLNDKENIIRKIRICKGSWENIEKVLLDAAKNYSKWFKASTEIQDKDKLTRSIINWIYFDHEKISMFYVCLNTSPSSLMRKKCITVFQKNIEKYLRICIKKVLTGFYFGKE
jgi:hypothetical protein